MLRGRQASKVRKRGVGIAALLAIIGAIALLAPAASRLVDRVMAPAPIAMPPPAVALLDGVRITLGAGGPAADIGAPLTWIAEGRVLRDPGGRPGLFHEWPGIAVLAQFQGDALRIAFDDPENRFRLIVDGRAVAEITRPGKAVAMLEGLGDRIHNMRLERLSEAGSPRRIVGLGVPAPGLPLPPPPLSGRRIDYYGDSDTVGYGNTRASRHCDGDDVFLSTDTSQAYPARLARRYGAEAAVMARSGIGLIRSLSGAPEGQTMLAVHNRVLPSRAAPLSPPDPAAWLIIVEVGGNDFVEPLRPTDAWPDEAARSRAFEQALDGFLRQLSNDNPGTPILILAVPDAGSSPRPELARVASSLQSGGAPVSLVPVSGLDHRGCHWHPSMADHARIEAAAAATIDRLRASGTLAGR